MKNCLRAPVCDAPNEFGQCVCGSGFAIYGGEVVALGKLFYEEVYGGCGVFGEARKAIGAMGAHIAVGVVVFGQGDNAHFEAHFKERSDPPHCRGCTSGVAVEDEYGFGRVTPEQAARGPA